MTLNNSIRDVKINLSWEFLRITKVTSWSQTCIILKKYKADKYMLCWEFLLAKMWWAPDWGEYLWMSRVY